MQVSLTGSTGLIGNAIARALIARGHEVRALVRDEARARALVPSDIQLIPGDITDPGSLPAAFKGAEVVFHAAGLPEQWARDRSVFDRVNRQGTRNVLDAARAAGVERVVYTSTMDVFRAGEDGLLRETEIDPHPKHSAYEHSKQLAEQEADRVRSEGLDVVFLNPCSVYGPSPIKTGMNEFFERLLAGKAPMVPPGGASIAYIDAVADAHVAAMDRGRSGERYLLADGHMTMKELADLTVNVAGLERTPKVAPRWLLSSVAAVMEPLGKAFGIKPMVTRDAIAFLMWNARCDTTKAQRELGYTPVPIPEGVRRTVDALRM